MWYKLNLVKTKLTILKWDRGQLVDHVDQRYEFWHVLTKANTYLNTIHIELPGQTALLISYYTY